jgi:hypothetical protein
MRREGQTDQTNNTMSLTKQQEIDLVEVGNISH